MIDPFWVSAAFVAPVADLPLCGPCKRGDHSSHDPTPERLARSLAMRAKGPYHHPYGVIWELTDCKTGVPPNSQCCCDATRTAALKANGLDEDGRPLSP